MHNKFFILIIFLAIFIKVQGISPDNICTFRTQGKLFSLTYLQTPTPYKIIVDSQTTIYYNFCFYFTPPQCPNQPSAFSYIVTQIQSKLPDSNTHQKIYKCQKYSSNLTTSLFYTKYTKQQNEGILKLMLFTSDLQIKNITNLTTIKQTQIIIKCSQNNNYQLQNYQVEDNKIIIQGQSINGCPVFEISSLWQVLLNHQIVCGILAFILGFYLLFYGRIAIQITVFIAVFFISLTILGSILTLFISPNSSTFTIYISFVILLFISCILGYLATKLINISIFFIGAFFGFIIGILVSSIFSKIFNIYASWELYVFILIFSIPLGLLTFKYHNNVIILSTAFTGAYLVVRPFSWIFGGFPNEFLLYQKVQSNQISTLPTTFFIYLFFIIVLAIIGAMYQHLKLKRQILHQNPHLNSQIQVNIIQQHIQAPIDALKIYFDKIIGKHQGKLQNNQNYNKMEEINLEELSNKKKISNKNIF